MKNKKWKRIAKRLKGSCIRAFRECKRPCTICDRVKECTMIYSIWGPSNQGIRKIEKVCKHYNIKQAHPTRISKYAKTNL